jgi:transposase-like protein
MYLWRAVDAEGEVLDILVQARRDQRAAQSLMRKLLRKFGMSPSSVTTDCLPSYAAALSELGLSKKHVQVRVTLQPIQPPNKRDTHVEALHFAPAVKTAVRIENSGRRPSPHGARLSA